MNTDQFLCSALKLASSINIFPMFIGNTQHPASEITMWATGAVNSESVQPVE